MRETTGPDLAPLAPDAHLLEPLVQRAANEPDRVLYAWREGDRLVEQTFGEAKARIWAVAAGLIASGVEPGDRVALMSHTRPEWALFDYAILAAGAVTVPIYETSSAEQVQWVIGDSGAVLALVESPALREVYDSVAESVPACREVLVIDGGCVDELVRRGEAVGGDTVDARVAGIRLDDIATIIYTSGTTGRPKGCVLTHRNLRTNVGQNLDALGDLLADDGERSLMFLPLAHSLSKILMLVGVEKGVVGIFATDVAHLVEELPMARPTTLTAVPRIFEKVYNAAQHKAHAEGHGAIFDKAAEVAVRWSEQRAAHGHANPPTAVEHAAFDRLVYGKLRDVFGGELRSAFSGGGPLGARLTHFFCGIGVKVLEGYGLTETSPTLTVNRADAWKPGTVGRPVAGTTIRIADDGEILAKGPQVFQGYWHNDAATAETFDEDGWFRTGDIGELDDDGFLHITGRKKELLVTAAGKNVAPAPLEDRLRAHPFISQAVVVGDNRPFIAALLTLDGEAVLQWAAEQHREGATVAGLAEDEALLAALQEAVDDANKSVSRAESIRKFAVLPQDLSIEAGELTPTLKVRRAQVEKGYGDVIERLYH